MGAKTEGGAGRWAWAAGTAVVGVALLGLLFGRARPPGGAPAARGAKPIVVFDRSQARESVELLDPAPLFLPTKFNAAQTKVAWPEPGGAFQSDPGKPQLRFNDPELKLGLPPAVTAPAKPADALAADGPGALAAGFGRAEPKIAPLAARGAFVRIVSARTGQPAISALVLKQIEALSAQAHPPEPASGQQWQPMEFLAAVDSAGLVGPPAIVEWRSGEEEVQRYFQNFLVQTLRLGERLAPGFYRISVGP